MDSISKVLKNLFQGSATAPEAREKVLFGRDLTETSTAGELPPLLEECFSIMEGHGMLFLHCLN